MIDDGFGYVKGVRHVRHEGYHGLLKGRKLRYKLASGFGIAVEPSFDNVELIGEVDCSRTKRGGVEGSFFKTDRSE